MDGCVLCEVELGGVMVVVVLRVLFVSGEFIEEV